MLDFCARLEDGYRRQEVGGQYKVLIPVNGKTMWVKLLVENAQDAWNVLWPLVDDVVISICLNQTTRRSASSRAHVRKKEATVRLSSYLIGDG